MVPTSERAQGGPRTPGMVALGRRLRQLRGLRSQREVAREAGISRGYLSELEQGKRPRPRITTLAKLAVALGTTLDVIQPSESVTEGEGAATPRRPEPPDAASERSERAAPAPGPITPGAMFRVYRWGTVGDPRHPVEAPVPLAYERVPVGKETVVGMDGFSIIVKGDKLQGWRVKDGDLCFINPGEPARPGHLVGAVLLDSAVGEGMGVYELASAEDAGGAERVGGPTVLRIWPEKGRPEIVPTQRFRVLGPVVGIMSWRSPDEGRARRLGAQELEEQRYGAEGGRGGPAVPGPERPPRVNAPPGLTLLPTPALARPGGSPLLRLLKA